MASEKAKQLAREQKEEAKRLKLAKKNSSNPTDWGVFRQLRETYKITHQFDSALPWILLICFLLPILAILLTGYLLDHFIYSAILAIPIALLVAMLVFVRRAKAGAFRRYENQPGAGEVALSMLPKKKWVTNPAITANKQLDVIHRALGPGGLVLIGEGEPGRLKSMLNAEKKRHEQIAYGVDVEVVQIGNKDGQVPLNKLTKYLTKLPKKLRAAQISEISSRLKALDNMRPRVPIPKGPMPSMKGARKAMRGR